MDFWRLFLRVISYSFEVNLGYAVIEQVAIDVIREGVQWNQSLTQNLQGYHKNQYKGLSRVIRISKHEYLVGSPNSPNNPNNPIIIALITLITL